MKKIKSLLQPLLSNDFLWFTLVSVFIFLMLLPHSTAEHCNVDEGIYLTCIKDMLTGGTLYKTTWEHKGPGIFYLYLPAVWAFDNNLFLIRLYHNLVLILSMFFVYHSTRFFLRNRFSLIPPLAYGLFFLNKNFQGKCINGEPAMMFMVSVASFFFLKYYLRSQAAGDLGLCAVFSAAAILTKPTSLFTVLAFPATVFTAGLSFGDWKNKKLLRDLVFFASVVGVVFLLTLIHYFLEETLWEFLDAFYYVNQQYQGQTRFLLKLRRATDYYLNSLSADPAVFFGTLAFIHCLFSPLNKLSEKKMRVFLLNLFVFSYLGFNWGGRMYPHYFLQMGLSLSLLTGFMLYQLNPSNVDSKKIFAALFFVLILASNIPKTWETFLRNHDRMGEGYLHQLSGYVAEETRPGDRIFVGNRFPLIYFLSDRKPATKYFFISWHQGVRREIINPQNQTFSDFQKHKPTLIVWMRNTKTYLNPYINENYFLEERSRNNNILRLNNSS
ncbi:MAG: hypothetical protein GF334_06050 [Candidatus Altiarchaeales archaeon]|nr:hypothetical protein [Candidatus Altiarchaeales archaeon]